MTIENRSIHRDDASYPQRLLELARPPDTLFAAGELPPLRSVAIVGTRRADAAGIAFTERLARELAGHGIAIVSGGAQGIDGAAHRGALAASGQTFVVHGTSLSALFPRAHHKLFKTILERGGGWISETPVEAPTKGFRFLQRNRIIAALCEIVIVVQAPSRSGALSTAAHARELGRPVFAVPASPWDPRGQGTLALLAKGARLCRSAKDVVRLLGLPSVPIDPPPKAARSASSRDAERVLAALREGAGHVDTIAERTKLSAARVQVTLVELSVAGLARHAGGVWRA